jgi:hypothetical protein
MSTVQALILSAAMLLLISIALALADLDNSARYLFCSISLTMLADDLWLTSYTQKLYSGPLTYHRVLTLPIGCRVSPAALSCTGGGLSHFSWPA